VLTADNLRATYGGRAAFLDTGEAATVAGDTSGGGGAAQ
jgi:hypothetical protein